MRVIMLAPPGAGKGTQGERIAARYGIPHISSGDIFRDEVARRTPLGKQLSGYLDRVKAVSRTTVVERVEDYIRGSLPSGSCSIEHCAKKLGTSVRTLQADLSERGLRFSDILEEQRIHLASNYLGQDQLTLDEVAVLLGYSEQSSFGRAFKRWTGSTPQQFRAVQVPPPATSTNRM